MDWVAPGISTSCSRRRSWAGTGRPGAATGAGRVAAGGRGARVSIRRPRPSSSRSRVRTHAGGRRASLASSAPSASPPAFRRCGATGGSSDRRRSPTWRSFLRLHAHEIWACDCFTVQTLTFRTLYVCLFISHDRRRPMHWDVTAHPDRTVGLAAGDLSDAGEHRPAVPHPRSRPQRRWGLRTAGRQAWDPNGAHAGPGAPGAPRRPRRTRSRSGSCGRSGRSVSTT